MQEAFPSRTGAQLVELRTHLGVEQKAIAEVLGVTPTTLYRWERDLVRVTPVRFARYQAACESLLARAAEVAP